MKITLFRVSGFLESRKFITVSGEEINPLYTSLELEGIDFER